MAIKHPYIPKEVDADVATSIIIPCIDANTEGKATYTYDFKGVSERTALGDVLTTNIKNKQNDNPTVIFSLKRDSLYHILPEYLFHPLDRYLGADGDPDEFEKKYKEQEEQKRNALLYFKPFDSRYQKLKIDYQRWLDNNVFKSNQFIVDYLTHGYPYNRQNCFILAVIPCLSWVRNYRGNDEMISTSLNYAFRGNADIEMTEKESIIPLTNDVHFTLEGSIDDLYCGDSVVVLKKEWHVKYQTEIPTAEAIDELNGLIREFRTFYQEWFLSVEQTLEIEFGDRNAQPILADNKCPEGVFLNYSTQLIK